MFSTVSWLFTNYASQCQGQRRDKQGQAGTSRDKAGTSRDKAGTNRDKQGQAGTVPVCPCLSLLVPVCPCLSMSVPVSPCRSLLVLVCPCWSLSVPVGPCQFLSVPVGPCWSLSVPVKYYMVEGKKVHFNKLFIQNSTSLVITEQSIYLSTQVNIFFKSIFFLSI